MWSPYLSGMTKISGMTTTSSTTNTAVFVVYRLQDFSCKKIVVKLLMKLHVFCLQILGMFVMFMHAHCPLFFDCKRGTSALVVDNFHLKER